MATMQDLANLLQAQQQTMQAQLAELRGIQRASWRTAMGVSGTAAGSQAPAAGGVAGALAGGGGPGGGGPGGGGGGVNRSRAFGRDPSLAASALASHPTAGGAYAAGGAAALAFKVSSAAVKHFGELSAVRSDRSIGAVEKEFQSAERNMSFFTLGFGNGWLRNEWNKSGQSDFRDAVAAARSDTMQYAAAAHEMGGTLGREELDVMFKGRLRHQEAFQDYRNIINAIEGNIAKTDPRSPGYKPIGGLDFGPQDEIRNAEEFRRAVEEMRSSAKDMKDAAKFLRGK